MATVALREKSPNSRGGSIKPPPKGALSPFPIRRSDRGGERPGGAETVGERGDRAQPGPGLVGDGEHHGPLPPLVDHLREPLAQRLDLARVELDRRHPEAAGAELDRAGARVTERDPRPLQVDQVGDRLGRLPKRSSSSSRSARSSPGSRAAATRR